MSGILALAFVLLAVATAGAASTNVDVTLRLGDTDLPGEARTIIGAVDGTGIGHGGVIYTLTESDTTTGEFVLYDGNGSIKGTLTTTRTTAGDGTVSLDGTQTITGGTGRYARARGELALTAHTDSTSVPAVTVLRGTLSGIVRHVPGKSRRARPRRRTFALHGEEAKIDFVRHDDGSANTVNAGLAEGSSPAPGIFIWANAAVPGNTFATSFVLYTADGVLRGSGRRPRTQAPTKLAATDGTGRFARTRGPITYTFKSFSDTLARGRYVSYLNGKLRF